MDQDRLPLNRFLALCNVGSRRACTQWIKDGRVEVDGSRATRPEMRVRPAEDAVTFDGRRVVPVPPRNRTILLHKPRGYVCSRAGQGSRTVYELLHGIDESLVPVGRLDKDSEGLLLMSNDGSLTQRITHPRFEQEKIYHVTVSGAATEAVLGQLRSPLPVEGRCTRPAEVRILRPGVSQGRTVIEFLLREGRKRQIRRICNQAGLVVHRLVRTRIGDITLRGLKPGQWRDMTSSEMKPYL
ncbi:pseudouridine synthase [Verrucomicrobiota bacterium]